VCDNSGKGPKVVQDLNELKKDLEKIKGQMKTPRGLPDPGNTVEKSEKQKAPGANQTACCNIF